MRRRHVPTPTWKRYLRPPPPPQADVRIFTWGVSVLGVLFFAVVLGAFNWRNRAVSSERQCRMRVGTHVHRPSAAGHAFRQCAWRDRPSSPVGLGGVLSIDGDMAPVSDLPK
jgi:hypothetical protein